MEGLVGEVDGGAAEIEVVGGGGSNEFGALLGVGHAEVHGGLSMSGGEDGGEGQEEKERGGYPAQHAGRGRC